MSIYGSRPMAEQRDAAIIEGHKQAERAERQATALRRIRVIASDAVYAASTNAPEGSDRAKLDAALTDAQQDLMAILAEVAQVLG